jgi:small subunit ribosomal protein S6
MCGETPHGIPHQDLLDGYYVFMSFASGAAFPAELDDPENHRRVIRSLIICKDE